MKLRKVINNQSEILFVKGNLEKIGNQSPYFAVTGSIWKYSVSMGEKKGGDSIISGCIHDETLKEFPDLADFIALHLSDISGSPMHAVEKGWYWLGKTKYQVYDRVLLAKHLRITEEEADLLHEFIATKEEFKQYCKEQRPRWKAEADAVITKYKLGVVAA